VEQAANSDHNKFKHAYAGASLCEQHVRVREDYVWHAMYAMLLCYNSPVLLHQAECSVHKVAQCVTQISIVHSN
jgi:hypothetical protein